MNELGAIYAYSYAHVVLLYKVNPIVINERCVGLKNVPNITPPKPRGCSASDGECLLVKARWHRKRLPKMPEESDRVANQRASKNRIKRMVKH
jgi:hypothetical protein